ncbi:undecaprenyl/decaprenyl-phosphate alpha-N-acetylglucosaminyl 1-phosphate transferase, partial [Candidatus Uhrbacteria bacterium]|nr:undecaprenyl/decaprenyl-phosphate alpha-N-acetylglucosaminyl 1-phosphate transferase [Candidatus Uhrbacteria bacterium]
MMWFLLALTSMVAFASWLATFGSRWLAHRFNVVDRPTGGRKIHTKTMPLLGGLGIGVVMFVCFSVFVQNQQMFGFLIGLAVLLIVGVLDDRFNLSPYIRFPLYAIACLTVMFTGTTIHQVTRLTGHGGMSLGWLEFPITFVWLFGVTLTMKVLDGLDGLVTGQTVIGAGLIAALALSPAYFQPLIALLAMVVAAVYL